MTSVALAVLGGLAIGLSIAILKNLERFTDEARKLPAAPTGSYTQGGFGCGAIAIGLLGGAFLVASLVLIGK
jgi:hypothetical protein